MTRARRPSHLDECQHLSAASQSDRIPESAARPRRGAKHRARDHAGDAGRGDGHDDLHATPRTERSRDRRAGPMLRAQRRDRSAAGHDSIPQRARRKRNQLAPSTFRQRREHQPGLGPARRCLPRASRELRVAGIPQKQARTEPLLDTAELPTIICNATPRRSLRTLCDSPRPQHRRCCALSTTGRTARFSSTRLRENRYS